MHRSLAIKEKALGPDHPDVAISLSSIAQLLQVRFAQQRDCVVVPTDPQIRLLHRPRASWMKLSLSSAATLQSARKHWALTTQMWRFRSATSLGCCRSVAQQRDCVVELADPQTCLFALTC